MRHETDHHRKVKRRLSAGLLVALALVSGALAFGSGAAFGEGGGDPIRDQSIDRPNDNDPAQRFRQDLANFGPSGPDQGNRADRGYRDRAYRERNYNNRPRGYYRHDGRSYQPNYRSYSYADPYYYNPRPSPGINLLFGF